MGSKEYDLIVVGGGFAGLTAALRAAELGLSSIVLEQGAGERYPCNSRMSGGILHLAMHDPFRSPEDLCEIAGNLSAGDADDHLVAAFAGTGKRLIEWLQGHGATFMRFGPQEAYRWCLAPPRAVKAGSDWVDRGPDRLLQLLERLYTELGGRVQRNTRVRSLRMSSGTCTGVVSTDPEGEKEWNSRFVLLSDGGFQANRDYFQRYIGPSFDRVFQRGAATGRGDGLRMAVEAGAAVKGDGRFYGHLLCADAFQNEAVWPYPQLDMVATAGIIVNGEGRRIADEGRGGVYLANMMAGLAMDRVFAILDQAIWDGPGRIDRIPVNPCLLDAGGTVHVAESITELAERIGVPGSSLLETVAEYNAAVHVGNFSALDVDRTTRIAPYPIENGPFRAIPICAGITYTMSGIAIDGNAQVLDEEGHPIPGLLAAGSTTGGLEGGRNAAYLGGLLKAGVFGLLAAERAAASGEVKASSVPAAASPVPAAPCTQEAGKNVALSRFPVLRFIVLHGISASLILAVLVCGLVSWAAIPSFGIYAVPVGILAGTVAGIVTAAFTELIRLITELLMP